jgi:Domain of unknown function (DUF4349)
MDFSSQSLKEGFRSLFAVRRRLLLVAGSVLALAILVSLTSTREPKAPQSAKTSAPESSAAFPPFSPDARIDVSGDARAVAALPVPPANGRVGGYFSASTESRVTYSAELSVATKEFLHARTSMEEILDRHRGYTAKLRMVGQPSGSTLSATLRVPASEYTSALAELKSIGSVERDEESADEIVQQHGDLEARLQNAQNAERHLQEMLKDNSGKFGGVSPIEQQLAQLHMEMERLQAERRSYDNRAVFSNIYFSMREDRPAPVESFSAQLRSATAGGLSDAFRTLSTILLFFVNYAPSLLLWAAILFLPVRILWRRSQSTIASTPA